MEIYRIFSVLVIDNDYFYTKVNLNNEEFSKHILEFKNKSIYSFLNFEYQNKMIVLQSCSQLDEDSYVVIGALLIEKEKL